MSDGVSESHFYMWRAIFAIAHVDGNINREEEAFMDEHLKSIPFTLQQKAILEDDIIHPKDPGEMLANVTAPQDQGMFFQFARMMCWSDGNYDVQEKEIMERLLGAHMEKLDVAGLTQAMHSSRQEMEQSRQEQTAEPAPSGEKKGGLGSLISRMFALKDSRLPKDGISQSRFYMWRTIFAMAHADDIVTDDERKFMYKALSTEHFSKDQKDILEKDIDHPQDIAAMFMKIGEQEDRSKFFYFARMMCWSDGNFDEQEQEIMLKLKSIHVRNVDIDKMIGQVDMQLDEQYMKMLEEDMETGGNIFTNFLNRFRTV